MRIVTLKNMYIGEGVKHPGRELFKLRIGKTNPFIYLLCVPEGKNNLEIVNSVVYKQKLFKKSQVRLAGICNGYDEAVEMVENIVKDSYSRRGDYDIKSYLMGL